MARTGVLTKQADDFPRWYQDLVAKAGLAENGPVRGTQIIRPTGYAIWERMQAELDERIKATGAQNVSLPVFIPESYFHREAEHVEGFSPELAVVTHAGGKELEEPIVVRPTSETLFGDCMARWVQSYRDLPLLLNQWCNVVRWELRTRLFLRSSEFLWQEGHTAHASREDAAAYARTILYDVYADFMTQVLAVPVVPGRKTAHERFAGAVNTMTLEGMMRDGKALQMGTSHEFGQRFSTAFDVRFLSASGQQEYAWTTSWGASTRLMGGLIMAHGDDAGLRLPPRLAPTQCVVMVVKDGPSVGETAAKLADELRASGVRVQLDDRADIAFGRRAIDWELAGVPLRVEIGPRDLERAVATVVRRIPGTKEPQPLDTIGTGASGWLEDDQAALYAEALEFRDSRLTSVRSFDEAVEAARTGWARIPWAQLGPDGEARLAEHSVTVRCLIRPDGSLPDSEDEPDTIAVVGRAY